MWNLCLSFLRGSDTKLEPVCNLDTHIIYCIFEYRHTSMFNKWLIWRLRLILALFSIFPLSFNNDNDRSIGNHEISTPNHEDMDGISENESRLVKYEIQDHMLLSSFRSNDRSIWYNDAIFIYIYLHTCFLYANMCLLFVSVQALAESAVGNGGRGAHEGGGQADRIVVISSATGWPDWICQEKVRRFLWS